MKRKFLALTVVGALVGPVAARAAPITIDFEALTTGTVSGGSVTINAGSVDVTFSGLGLQVYSYGSQFGGAGNVITSGSFFGPLMVSFGGGVTAAYIEFENHYDGSYPGEVDTITGTAFDASSAILDTLTSSANIHRLNGPGIASATYAALSTGFVLDNFTFDVSTPITTAAPDAVVPTPGTLALLGLGIGGLGWSRRRSSR